MFKVIIAICVSCAATCAAANEGAPPSSQAAQCAPQIGAIGVIRRRIDAGRKILSIDEADCAFEEFTTSTLSRYCTQVKRGAITDAAKRHTWNDIQHAWDVLNRMRLQLRQTEDRLGIECESG